MGEQLRWGRQAHLEADIWLAAAAHVSGLLCVWKSVLRGPSPPGLGRGEREEPDDWKNLLRESTLLFMGLHILLPGLPGSQLHWLSPHKGFLFFVIVIPRMRWRNFCLLKAFGKAVVSLPGLLAGITRRSSYLSKCTCWNLGPFEFPRLSEGFRKGLILPTLPQKVQIALFFLAAVGLPMHSLHKSGFRKFSIFLKYIINYFRNLNDTEMKNCPIEPKGNLAGEPPHLVFDILKNINILFSF